MDWLKEMKVSSPSGVLGHSNLMFTPKSMSDSGEPGNGTRA